MSNFINERIVYTKQGYRMAVWTFMGTAVDVLMLKIFPKSTPGIALKELTSA